jgi:hypothetical protein
MWLLTSQGFYSVVAHLQDPSLVLVRSRTRDDLLALRTQVPSLELWEDPSADYRWRAEVTREDWRVAVSELANVIDYGNFKSEVALRQGSLRATLYERVWSMLRALQEDC